MQKAITSVTTTFIAGTTLVEALKSIRKRLKRLVIFSIRRRGGRYIQLSPSVFTRQFLFDRKQQKLLDIEIRNSVDAVTLSQIFFSEHYSLEKLTRYSAVSAFYNHTIQSGKLPLIIDCGGNIGLASRYFSENYPQSWILCIEPDPANVIQAKRNNTSNIVFLQNAIGSEMKRGTIIDPGLGNNSYRISCEGDGNIGIISVNDLLEKYSSYVPYIIKIDIEGFESELFSKNIEWVEKFPLLIIELHDWMFPKSSNSKNFLKAISALDRDFVYYGENIFSISNTLI